MDEGAAAAMTSIHICQIGETLAQIAILFIFSRSSTGFSFPLRTPSLTDNTGAEAGNTKLFLTTTPLTQFLERWILLCTISGMELDLSYILATTLQTQIL